MAVEPDADRLALIAALRQISASPDVIDAAEDPAVDMRWFGMAEATPFWARVLAAGADGASSGPLPVEVFAAAASAYLARWRLEHEQAVLLADASALARRARHHLRRRTTTP